MTRLAHACHDAAMKVEAVRPTRWTQPLELFALMAGFVFVMAAQWTSWFHASVSPGTSAAMVPEILLHGSIGITDATGGLTVPYYLGWFAVFGVCTAAVLGTPSVRALTGALGLGLIGGQALLVFSIVHTRGLGTSDALNLPAGVHITRSAGAYAGVVALALFSLALLPAVRSSVAFPSAVEVRRSFARLVGREVRRSVVTAHEDDFPVRSGVIVEVGGQASRMPPLSAVGPAEETAPATAPDHSLYRRPIESTTSW
jgi:hypothetical protein